MTSATDRVTISRESAELAAEVLKSALEQLREAAIPFSAAATVIAAVDLIEVAIAELAAALELRF
ncbi:MAG: hypothetical protein ABIV06_10530 [Thermoanaerobaculia bacterium]